MKKQISQSNVATNHELPRSIILLKKLLWISLLCCIICICFAIQQQLRKFPITTIKINGQILRTSKQEISEAISALVKNNFFMVDIAAIKVNLQTLRWTETVTVEKIWPDKLAITIHEKIPIAKWRGKGLVTTSGDIVYTELLNDADQLPAFWGNENQVKQMLENYLLMSDALKQSKLDITEVKIMPDHGLRAILSNGMMLFLGREGLLDRLNRFTVAYRNKLQKISNKIDYVDLRYVNGIAIGWKNNHDKIYL